MCRLGLNDQELDKLLVAYKKGTSEVFLRGSKMKFGPIRAIRIYDNSKLPNSNSYREDVESSFEKLDSGPDTFLGTHYERVLQKMGRDITENFIQGEWGYLHGKIVLSHLAFSKSLKESTNKVTSIALQKFNIYIKYKTIEKKIPVYRIAAHHSEVEKLQKAYEEGKYEVVLDGTKTRLQGFHRIKIFKVADEYNGLSKEDLRKKLKASAGGEQLTESILRDFGTDVTSDYIKGEFGESITTKLPAVKVKANAFRAQVNNLQNQQTKDFVDEAIGCYSNSNYRAAVVLSWVGAISLLYDHIIQNHLVQFNAEASRVNAKWKNANTFDDLTSMKEHSFLQIIAGTGIIGKNVKQELEQCLQLRNSCGHPNSLVIGELRAAAHIETLILNVYTKFQ